MLLFHSVGYAEYDCWTQSYLNVPDRCVPMQVAEEGVVEAAEGTALIDHQAADYVLTMKQTMWCIKFTGRNHSTLLWFMCREDMEVDNHRVMQMLMPVQW